MVGLFWFFEISEKLWVFQYIFILKVTRISMLQAEVFEKKCVKLVPNSKFTINLYYFMILLLELQKIIKTYSEGVLVLDFWTPSRGMGHYTWVWAYTRDFMVHCTTDFTLLIFWKIFFNTSIIPVYRKVPSISPTSLYYGEIERK